MFFANFSLFRRAGIALAVALMLGTFGIGKGPAVTKAASNFTAGRTLRVVSTNANLGGEAIVSIEFESLGDEVAMGFSVNFDPSKLNTPVITLGSGAPSGTAITINQNQVASGRIGFLLDSMSAFAASPPARQAVSIKFTVAPDAPALATLVSLGNLPSPRSTSNFLGELLATSYEDGYLTIGTSGPASLELSGRVVTSAGIGLRNALVLITDLNDNSQLVPTGSMGYYTFTNLVPGKYAVTVRSRLYRFNPVTVQVNSSVSNLDFLGMQ
jgi:hypothetical protein